MDPRHPEQSISRLKELMKQYDRVEQDMKKASTSAQLAQLEREGGLVVQEICLVAPRIHEAMMQTSRQRRRDLAHGVLDEPQDTAVELGIRTKYEQPFEPVKKPVADARTKPVLDSLKAGDTIEVKKPAKKPAKKKSTKKKAKK